MIVYSIIIPVMPFQLERLGYQHVSSLAGWLLFAYVSLFFLGDKIICQPRTMNNESVSLSTSLVAWLSVSGSSIDVAESGINHLFLVATIPIALFSERYNVRQSPLILGLFILLGSQVMLMEAPNYAVMCVARVLQGIGSSLVWVVGLALL